MPISLDFETSHHYNKAIDGIDVPIAICIGKQSLELLAKLDTGATHCIFRHPDVARWFWKNVEYRLIPN